MRNRALGLVVAVLAAAAVIAPTGLSGPEPVHYFGIIRGAPGGWHVLDDAGHTPSGISSVACLSSGRLKISYPPVTEVGVMSVTADETWAGAYHPGASVGFSFAVVTLRSSTGTVVPCSHSAFANPSGNIWVDFWGWM